MTGCQGYPNCRKFYKQVNLSKRRKKSNLFRTILLEFGIFGGARAAVAEEHTASALWVCLALSNLLGGGDLFCPDFAPR
jgi:hypothetical protein